MSIQLINQYYNRVDKVIQYGGSNKETAIRNEFYNLVNQYCEKKHLILIPELDIRLKSGKTITPDGIVKNALRLDFGYWESKANVDLEAEIELKIRKGYPLNNTIFEDSKKIILYQDGQRKRVADMRDATQLDQLLHQFIEFEPQQVTEFNKAVTFFKQDIPQIVRLLREMIEAQEGQADGSFIRTRNSFLKLCQESINPVITLQDVNEMLIQHILTEEIFLAIFSDAQFLRENNIARELYKMEETFFTGKTKYDTLQSIKHYYDAIKAAAAPIADHHEKQTFLKVIYENFYKAYNPKGADRLGIVYTPSEIIKFMIEGTDFLLEKYFDKTLASKQVEILDPATGTGTFITDLIEYLPKQHLQHKFLHELHANEIAILPYYIANLNIEYTYRQRMGEYQPFSNICFVDTLDNLGYEVQAGSLKIDFGFSAENAQRIKRQNQRKISVIIGNPPYNANQENENDNNKNRSYFEDAKKKIGGVDGRIRETYIKESTAQKTKLYDMYSRFYRWASDRIISDTGGGILAFVTNRSFIDSRTFDGFRKSVAQEYDSIYILDTQSDVRANPKISGTGHNVFGIQTGVAIAFFIKTQKLPSIKQKATIFYHSLKDEMPRLEKLEWIRNNRLKTLEFERILPDEKGNWLNLTDNDFENLLPLASKEVKANKQGADFDQTIFKLFSLGASTNRDEWVIDKNKNILEKKVSFFISHLKLENNYNDNIVKWSRNLKRRLEQGKRETFNFDSIRGVNYRPYCRFFIYQSSLLIDEISASNEIFNSDNLAFAFMGISSDKPFSVLGTNVFTDLNFLSPAANGCRILPLYRYNSNGQRIDNITDWGLAQFVKQYPFLSILSPSEARVKLFYYLYAVLHNPIYRKKYEHNLKREFPRIPFYQDFECWASWGKTLMDLHLHYEDATPYPLLQENRAWYGDSEKKKPAQTGIFHVAEEVAPLYGQTLLPKTKLKADKTAGTIELDEKTILRGIPPEAWEYKLGNRSGLEWILDQYKESKSTDPTIAEKFNEYRFADYKTEVITLLQKVCTVSIETVQIVRAMEALGE